MVISGTQDKFFKDKIERNIKRISNLTVYSPNFIFYDFMDLDKIHKFNETHLHGILNSDLSMIGYADLWAINYSNFFCNPNPHYVIAMEEIKELAKNCKWHFHMKGDHKRIEKSYEVFYNQLKVTPISLNFRDLNNHHIILRLRYDDYCRNNEGECYNNTFERQGETES